MRIHSLVVCLAALTSPLFGQPLEDVKAALAQSSDAARSALSTTFLKVENPEDRHHLLASSLPLFRGQGASEAFLGALTIILDREPHEISALHFRGYLSLELKRIDRARSDLERAKSLGSRGAAEDLVRTASALFDYEQAASFSRDVTARDASDQKRREYAAWADHFDLLARSMKDASLRQGMVTAFASLLLGVMVFFFRRA